MENIALSLNHITKIYPGVVALDDVTFDIPKGKIHALMGENGAGKSTLTKVISGAIEPTEGSITIDGKTYTKLDPALSSKLGIGIIYQEMNNVPTLSVVENVFLGKKLGGKLCPDVKLMKKKAKEVFDKLGVNIPLDVMVSQLSIAQQQIVEIAKALCQDVKVLIMDEYPNMDVIGVLSSWAKFSMNFLFFSDSFFKRLTIISRAPPRIMSPAAP